MNSVSLLTTKVEKLLVRIILQFQNIKIQSHLKFKSRLLTSGACLRFFILGSSVKPSIRILDQGFHILHLVIFQCLCVFNGQL